MKLNCVSFLIYILFSTNIMLSKEISPYKCGVNNITTRPKGLKPMVKVNKTDPSYKRRMTDIDEDGFKTFNIYVDTKNLEKDLIEYKLNNYQDLIISSIEKAAITLQKLLKVKPLDDGCQFPDEILSDLGISDWIEKNLVMI